MHVASARRGFALVLALALASACGGGSTTGAGSSASATLGKVGSVGPGESDAAAPATCPVTKDQVKAATGLDVNDPTEQGAGTGCTFAAGEPGQVVSVIKVTSFGADTYDSTTKAFGDEEAVSGIGDKAAFAKAVSTLSVLAGDTYYSFQVLGLDDNKAAAIALAKLVV